MSKSKEVKEQASFRIKNADGNVLSFRVEGSVVGAIVEAFSWLPPARRQTLLDRLARKQDELTAKEAARDDKTGDLFEGVGA